MSQQQQQPSTSSDGTQQTKISIPILACTTESIKWEKNPSNYEKIKIVKIQNCATTLKALEVISSSLFRKHLKTLENFTILILKINEEINEMHAEKPKINEFLEMKKNILISYESSSGKIIYWKNGREGNYIKFNMTGHSLALTDFVRDFLIDIVDINLRNSNFDNLKLSSKLAKLKDLKNVNLLMRAVESENDSDLINDILNTLSLDFFDINQKSNDGKTAADIAWAKEKYQILLQLLEANSTFPSGFDADELGADEATENIKQFLQISNEIHNRIWSKDVTQISEKIQQKPNLRYFYNSLNISAATAALNAKYFEAYNILLENKCSIGPNENLMQIIDEIYKNHRKHDSKTEKLKDYITTMHDETARDLPEKHLLILYSNSKICHDDQNYSNRLKDIAEAFNAINKIEIVKHILQLASMHRYLKIYFDFSRSSIEFMNPSEGSPDTKGFYESCEDEKNKLYIGAKELLSDGDEKFDVFGTIAHEMCHFAMMTIFLNDGKPYGIDDYENELKFFDILRTCETNKNDEDIVRWVFDNYKEEKRAAELIVRVPHMIAHHQNNSQKLDKLKISFKELFDYFDQLVIPKMEKTLPMLKKLFHDSTNIKFDDLTDAYKAKIHHSEIQFQGVDVKFNEIIEDKNSKIFQHLTSEQICGILIKNENKVIIPASEKIADFYIERDFIDYDDNEKNSKNFAKISSIAVDTKMILLADHAGEGKTTTFKQFSLKLKKKFPYFWVSYIDLKKHLDVYENFEEKLSKDYVLDVLKEILSITDKLHVEIFTKIFESGRVILLFDGVDEIAPRFKEFFMKLIESVKNSNNQQWISTRPQHIKELKDKWNQKAFKLLPYDDEKKKQIIQNVLNNKKEGNVKAEDILNAIDKSFSDAVNNPLMLEMMTEIYVEDKKLITKFNLFLIYKKIIDLKTKLIDEKGSIVSMDCREQLNKKLSTWEVHQIYALKLLFKNGFEDYLTVNKKRVIDINNFNLLKRWPKHKSEADNNENTAKQKWTQEQISRYGFLIVDHWNAVDEFADFVHRTFAEFFIAHFLIKDLYDLPEDDYDEMSKEEIDIRVKLFIHVIFENNDTNFILSFVDTNESKKMHIHFYDVICGTEMRDLVSKHLYSENEMNVIKILSIDERFLKKFIYNNGRKIFQEFFINRHNRDDNLTCILDIIDIYVKSLGDEWFRHTGYSLKENFLMQSLEKIDEILVKEFSSIYEPNREMYETDFLKCKKFYRLLFFIDQASIPKNELLNFFYLNINDIFDYSFMSSLLKDKLMKIIEENFKDCKDEFVKLLKEELKLKKQRENLSESIAYKNNVVEFTKKLETFLSSDEIPLLNYLNSYI